MDRLEQITPEFHRKIKAGFILQGTTLRAWCLENDVKPQNANKAIKGLWTGPKATLLLKRILDAAGVTK